MTEKTEAQRLASDGDPFLQGVCVALHAVTGTGDGILWCDIVEAAGADELFQYAAHIEPEEWTLAGFDVFAESEMGRGKPKRLPTPPAAQSEPAQEPVAWRFTGIAGFKRFVTDAQYKAFSPEVRAWYEPFKCAICTTPPSAQRKPHTEQCFAEDIVQKLKDAAVEYGIEVHRNGIMDIDAEQDKLFASIEQCVAELVEQYKTDAVRYRWLQKGKAITVKCKKSTIMFGPNPEKDYGDELSKAIDIQMKGTEWH